MSRDEVDRTLARVQEERERISLNLVELENNVGHQFLQGAELSGVTQQRWATAQDHISQLWRMYYAYEGVINDAEQLRAARSRPSAADLEELTRLLSGPSIVLPREQNLAEGSLLDSGTDTFTLAEAVSAMTAAYDAAAAMVAAADAAWKILLPRLHELTQAKAELDAAIIPLEIRHPEHERIGDEVAAVEELVRGDPLALATTSSGEAVDTSRLDRALADITALRDELAHVEHLRDNHEHRIAELRAAIDEVATATSRTQELRAHVQARVYDPPPQDVPDPAPHLRAGLAEVEELRSAGSWQRLARRISELESAARTERARLTQLDESIRGLLERRAELRGRLDAYRMKASRLGQAEDPELTHMYRQARNLLWTAPSDLRTATVILARYQRAIQGYENGGTSG
ncbi:hypothetical protein RIF23_15200 [Lipingzhangella sp. LS1_29]|uniref:Uncharacterized protein n=1 Tax=Lipingzhangella rawalii TaxID=2055835 RepID=A0ABU2H8L8_9ACTN|nr:hypothetical protein [Lipingzhangella rawalii]MDS1271641.1 hypothetical protein [Lipingzhangella rawalii]